MNHASRIVIFLHGFGIDNANDSVFAKRFKNLLPNYTVYTPSYPYRSASATYKYLKEYIDTIKKKHKQYLTVTYAGLSMGGFWARHFANLDDYASMLLFNPVIWPHVQLLRYNHITGMSEDSCLEFIPYIVDEDKRNLPGLVIVAKNDDIAPPEDSVSVFSNSKKIQLILSDLGSHQLTHGVLENFQREISLNILKAPTLG